MASRQSTHSNKKKTTRKRGNTKSASAKAVNTKTELSPYQDEVILIGTLVVSVLLILSNFHLSGKVGEGINGFVFGIFGILAYLLPYILFIGVAFGISNRGNKTAKRKIISTISLLVVLSGLFQLLSKHYYSGTKILDYYTVSSKEKSGGGLIGGMLSHFLGSLFGEVGTYVILIAGVLILFVLITEKLLLAGIGKQGTKTLESVLEKRRLYQEQQDAYEEEEVTRRRARTVTFPKANKFKNEVTEISEPFEHHQSGEEETVLSKKSKIRGKGKNSEIPIYEEELKNKFHNSAFENPAGTSSTNVEEIFAEPIIHNFNQQEDVYATGDFSGIQKEEPEIVIENFTQDQSVFQEPSIETSIFDQSEEAVEVTQDTAVESKNEAKKESKIHSKDVQEATKTITDTITAHEAEVVKKVYQFPPIDLLSRPKASAKGVSDGELKATAMKLQSTLESFGVGVTVTNISRGPAVTRYELQPEQGVKVSKITNLADDIKLNLAAADVRIEAPIPGKAAVGIEVPNKENTAVMLRELIESQEFKTHSSDIAFAVGKDISGQTVVTDIAKMPHLLIAGATGSGKSVCINTLIMSILYKANPDDVKLIMVDPKVVELSVYNGIPHLLIPVVTDPKKASGALNWAVMEMTDRYQRFADLGVRDLKGYNEKVATVAYANDDRFKKMPQIVIIVDELADLMMVAPGEVEDAICRLAQMARAAGLHLIIATQRPSVNVITGLIKANVPSRIAFSVSSAIDSRTIIDGSGAEKLLGKGDMLFFPSGYPKPVRIQGAFVSDKEVSSVVEFLTSQNSVPQYNDEIANKIITTQVAESAASSGSDRDDYFIEAGKFIIEKDKASIGMLQRVYKIGFNRAARIMDQLCDAGVVGPEEGTKPRKVLMSIEEFENYVDEYV